jgi:hypothetical protein
MLLKTVIERCYSKSDIFLNIVAALIEGPDMFISDTFFVSVSFESFYRADNTTKFPAVNPRSVLKYTVSMLYNVFGI